MVWLYYIFVLIALILAYTLIITYYKSEIGGFIENCYNMFKYNWGILLYLIVGMSVIIGNIILLYNGIITSADFININRMITLISCGISLTFTLTYRR